MSMYTDFTRDFAERTLKNLDYIETSEKKGENTYEITQLINSFLGLIVFPQENDKARVSQVAIDSKIIQDLDVCITGNTYTGQYGAVNLQNLIYHFRNAISHGHIEPYANENGEIFKIEFQDQNPFKKNEEFRIEVEISLLRKFVRAFAEALITTYED